MSHDVQLGQTPATNAGRDAVHVAIIPVTAKEDLRRGDHVCLDEGRQAYRVTIKSKLADGIIDPFLPRQTVKRGEVVYMLLMPGRVTGMRHHWECSTIDGLDDALEVINTNAAVAAAEKWLDQYIASEGYELSAYEMVQLFVQGSVGSLRIAWQDEQFICLGGRDATGAITDELLEHLRVLAAEWFPGEDPYVPLDQKTERRWTCSC